MRTSFLALACAAGLILPPEWAFAQSNPGWSYGQVPTAGQWNTAFSQKQDYLGFPPLNSQGGSMTGELYTFPSSAGSAGLNIGVGSLGPGQCVNGDVWMTSAGMFYCIGAASVGPLNTGGGGGAATFAIQTDPLTVPSTNTLSTLTKSWNGVYVQLVVNGVSYSNLGAFPAFSVSGGSTVTWSATNSGHTLLTSDTVFAYYTATAVPVVPTLGAGVSVALQNTAGATGGFSLFGTPLAAGAAAANGALPHFANTAAIQALSGSPYTRIMRDAFLTQGDGGAMIYDGKPGACPAADNGAQIQATGECYFADFQAMPTTFGVWGAHNDGTDPYISASTALTPSNAVAIANAFTYINNLPILNGVGQYHTIDNNGGTYAVNAPISWPRQVEVRNTSWVAEAGSSWCPTDNSVTPPHDPFSGNTATIGKSSCGVITLPASSFAVKITDNKVDVNSIPGVTGLYCSAYGEIETVDLGIRHWGVGGAGYVADYASSSAYCSAVNINANIQQWTGGVDANATNPAKQNGVAIGVWSFDNVFIGGNFSNTYVPIYLAQGSASNNFIGVHFYTSPMAGPTPVVNPIGALVDSAGPNVFTAPYVDSAPFTVRMNTTVTALTIRDPITLYNAYNATFSGWIESTATVANTNVYDLDVCGQWPPTGPTNTFLFPYTFGVSGSGSWANPATVAAMGSLYGNACIHQVGSGASDMIAGLSMTGNLNLMQTGYVAGALDVPPVTLTGTTAAPDATWFGNTYLFNNGSVALTLQNTPTTEGGFTFVSTNANPTLAVTGGAHINGGTTTLTTLTAGKEYTVRVKFIYAGSVYWTVTGPGIL